MASSPRRLVPTWLTPNSGFPQLASGFCGGTLNRFQYHVSAHSSAGALGTDAASLESQLHWLDPSGNEVSTTSTVQTTSVQTTNGGKNTEFDINACSPESSSYTIALYFEVSGVSGNAYCDQET